MPSSEIPKIKKGSAVLNSDYYNTPKTSLMIFHFESVPFPSILSRLKKCTIQHASIDSKEFYLFDHFFEKTEGEELRQFFENASFSRHSYGSPESIEKGEKPAASMNNKERWDLFSSPPPPINELYKLFNFLASALEAEITTLPWELVHKDTGSPSVIANFHREISKSSQDIGKHQDCNPEEGVLFNIPILYSSENKFHENHFINGSIGKPWLVSMMLYSTALNFLPAYKMGTVFYKDSGEAALKADCLHTRLVFFAGDIFHSPEESFIPEGLNTWRTSYVFKLLINPKRIDQSLKESFASLFQPSEISLGPGVRV
jgi:hypothetical protein